MFATPTLALVPSTAAAEEAGVHSAYVKVKLARKGNTFAHPGYRIAIDEQGLFVIQCDGKNHEIAVSIRDASMERLELEVVYSIDGRTQLTEVVSAEAGEDVQLSKGKTKLWVNVNPQGSEDTSRDDDEIDKPKHDEDDPLGGM